jgi:hypothetical protein
MDELKTGPVPTENGAKGTVKYRCEVTCYDNVQLYRDGEVYEFPADKKPFKAEYFKKI